MSSSTPEPCVESEAVVMTEPVLPVLSVDRVARIRASLDIDPDLEKEILEANELDQETWEAVEDRTDAELRAALTQGIRTRLTAYDQAYLARLEEERGPVSIRDYGSIVTAQSRGDAATRLRELDLPPACELVLVRVFEERLANDPELRSTLKRPS